MYPIHARRRQRTAAFAAATGFAGPETAACARSASPARDLNRFGAAVAHGGDGTGIRPHLSLVGPKAANLLALPPSDSGLVSSTPSPVHSDAHIGVSLTFRCGVFRARIPVVFCCAGSRSEVCGRESAFGETASPKFVWCLHASAVKLLALSLSLSASRMACGRARCVGHSTATIRRRGSVLPDACTL